MNKNANSADVRCLTRANQKAWKSLLFGAWAWRREVAQKLNPPTTTEQLIFSKLGQFQPYENFQTSRHRHQVVIWIVPKPRLAWNQNYFGGSRPTQNQACFFCSDFDFLLI
mgnify:CR=1 FL=1